MEVSAVGQEVLSEAWWHAPGRGTDLLHLLVPRLLNPQATEL